VLGGRVWSETRTGRKIERIEKFKKKKKKKSMKEKKKKKQLRFFSFGWGGDDFNLDFIFLVTMTGQCLCALVCALGLAPLGAGHWLAGLLGSRTAREPSHRIGLGIGRRRHDPRTNDVHPELVAAARTMCIYFLSDVDDG
jgi:hypothetical protein